MVQAGAVAQQIGGQRVPGLMADVATAEVEFVDPVAEVAVEGGQADSLGAARVAVPRDEQRQRRAFGGGGWAAMPLDEPLDGLAAPRLQQLENRFGDADGLVVVADLGLVVPKQRQPVVAVGAVQPQVDHLAQPPPGRDQRLPDVTQPDVVAVVFLGQQREVRGVSQGFGHVVRERAAGADFRVGRCGSHDDEPAVQTDRIGPAAIQRRAQQRPNVGEDGGAKLRGDGGEAAVLAVGRQRGQGVPFPVAPVGDEPVHMLLAQHRGIVPAVRGIGLQECAQFGTRQTHPVERGGRAWALGRAQPISQVVPQQVTQPPLRCHGEVVVSCAAGEPDAEVLGFQEPRVTGVGRREVDQSQLVQHFRSDELHLGWTVTQAQVD